MTTEHLQPGGRVELGRSQGEVAESAGVSRQWLSEVESGKPTAEVGLVLRVLDALLLDLSLTAREAEDAVPPAATIEVADLDEVLDEYRRR